MRRTLAALLAALLLSLGAGCAARQRTEEDARWKLWFPAAPGQELSEALSTCPYEGEGSIPALLSALLAGPPEDAPELVRVIPAGTRVLSWSLDNRVANVELSAAYAGLVGVDLTLADCCVTLTLTQLEGVDGVRVTVNGGGQAYRERPVLYRSDVLFSGAEETPVEVAAALYFRREGGDGLGFELRKFRLTDGKLPVKAVLSALIAGPEEKGLLPLLPAELTVRSAWMEDGCCHADLSAHLLDLSEAERALAVLSITDTLCSLDTVERVQLLVEGQPIAEGAADGEPLEQNDRQTTR